MITDGKDNIRSIKLNFHIGFIGDFNFQLLFKFLKHLNIRFVNERQI
jgi:hypothetical protein